VEAGYECDVDISGRTIDKKVALAQTAHYNFILVVGKDEAGKNSVNLRVGADNSVVGLLSMEELLAKFSALVNEFK